MAAELLHRIRQIWEAARSQAARSVNSAHVCANWLIGQQIIEAEQGGAGRAAYGTQLLETLSADLGAEYGSGFSVSALRYMRLFYLGYPDLVRIHHAVRDESGLSRGSAGLTIVNALRSVSADGPNSEWRPGQLHPGLGWTHYRALLKVARREARGFYEIEAVKSSWSGRQLERQINSLLFERLLKSRDKAGVLALASEGLSANEPADVIKDPYVLEFLDLPESHRLVESRLEEALIDNLQGFLLELGKGFAFVARQQRLTLDGDHFYVDLVFYHAVLKCYVVIDLKVGKLTHADLGQLQLYVNYYDQERLSDGDNPTLGLILCTDKNDAVVRYTLGPALSERIFASRYQLYLPTEEELAAEIRRELRQLVQPAPKPKRRTRKR
jgi:predicted nuclease of restriction endonuclease-like (RecB) superfamily